MWCKKRPARERVWFLRDDTRRVTEIIYESSSHMLPRSYFSWRGDEFRVGCSSKFQFSAALCPTRRWMANTKRTLMTSHHLTSRSPSRFLSGPNLIQSRHSERENCCKIHQKGIFHLRKLINWNSLKETFTWFEYWMALARVDWKARRVNVFMKNFVFWTWVTFEEPLWEFLSPSRLLLLLPLRWWKKKFNVDVSPYSASKRDARTRLKWTNWWNAIARAHKCR